MVKLKHLSIVLAGCLFIGGSVAEVAAQSWDWERGRDRDGIRGERDRGDRDRAMRGRDRYDDDDDDRDRRRGRDRYDDDDRDRRRGRDRDRDGRGFYMDRDRGYFDRGRNCYVVRRRMLDRNGDVIIRRSRVCED